MFTDLEQYRPTHLEAAVVDFYRRNGVRSPQDIDLEMFAYDAGIWVHFMPSPSTSHEFKQGQTIIVDNRLPWEQQRVEFAHELGHVLLHAGRQEFMTDDFRARQEFQADLFAMYALAPTYMLVNHMWPSANKVQLVSHLANNFNVPDTFMDVRLNMLHQRMYQLAVENQMAVAVMEASTGYDYSYRHALNHRVEYLVKNGVIVGRRMRADI